MSEEPWPQKYFTTLEEAFAFYTECALATAEGLEMRKTAAKHEKQRARGIADNMVDVCRRHGVKCPGRFDRLPRLREAMGGTDK
jgi:hypothetical protein